MYALERLNYNIIVPILGELTDKSSDAPVVISSDPKMNSSATLPPIKTSISANICDLVLKECTFFSGSLMV